MRAWVLSMATLWSLAGCRELAGIKDLGPDGGDRLQLELALVGDGLGHVHAVLAPGDSFDCPPDCTIPLREGGEVRLTATTRNGEDSLWNGWDSPLCEGARNQCMFTLSESQRVGVRFIRAQHNVIFVSSRQVPADLGGLAPYDAICNELASAAGINSASGLGFVAWLSLPQVSASERLQGARGFIRSDGLPVANVLTEPRSGLLYPVTLDEERSPAGEDEVLTGTTALGTPGRSCTSFTSNLRTESAEGGRVGDGPALWTSGIGAGCALSHRLYCVGLGKSATLAPQPSDGKLIFLSSAGFRSGLGAGLADELCEREKPPAQASATFRALLSTVAAPATRWLLPEQMYVRLDGTRVGSGAALTSGMLESGVWQTGTGDYVTDARLVATGGVADEIPADGSGATCADWSSPTGVHHAGEANRIHRWWASVKASCDASFSVYCVQQ